VRYTGGLARTDDEGDSPDGFLVAVVAVVIVNVDEEESIKPPPVEAWWPSNCGGGRSHAAVESVGYF